MATQEKTVRYSIPMYRSTVNDATTLPFVQITIDIPEASPTFTSVYAVASWQDQITLTGGTVTEHRVALRLGAAAYTTFTETDDLANTGENMAFVIGPIDFTSHFNTNWSGTSMTLDSQIYVDFSTGSTTQIGNAVLELFITYTSDDAAATQLKTIEIPFDTQGASLSTTANNIYGTAPQLTGVGGILPEGSVTLKDYYFVIEGNSGITATTDVTINASLNSGSAVPFVPIEGALASGCYHRFIFNPRWDLLGSMPASSTTHDLNLWCNVANLFGGLSVSLVVTYTFDLASTTKVLNSIMLPIEITSPLGSSTTSDISRFQRDFLISEPGTITMRQSGYRINTAIPGALNTLWRAGSQSYAQTTHRGVVMCGMDTFQRRLDSGGAQGAGITLARGVNTITIDGYCTTTVSDVTNINGYAIINYESDLAAGGLSKHSRIVFKVLQEWNALLADATKYTGKSFSIPQSDYLLTAAGVCMFISVSALAMALIFDAEILSGESQGAGFAEIYADAYVSDAERGTSITFARGRDIFKRFPQDIDNDRLDIETSRKYRIFATTGMGHGTCIFATYHSHTWSVAGNISNNDGALPTEIRLINADTLEIEQEQVLTAGTTAFDFTVYNDVVEYFVEAYQDGTHVGRSAKGVGV